jgi:hypothetical protein
MTLPSPSAPASPAPSRAPRVGEPRWPMALAVLGAGALRAILPAQLRAGDARWALGVVLVALLAVLVVGDPGRIDRDSTWLRVMTGTLIGVISLANAIAVIRLVAAITFGEAKFTNDANVLLASGAAVWLTNVIAFGLWYWDLDRGGAAARARRAGSQPAFVFPEMANAQYVGPDWSPKFLDYLHLSFMTSMAFSPTDVSAIRPWAKLMMMAQATVSLLVAILVIARAINILK